MATLVKITDDAFNGMHPNGINAGYQHDGPVYNAPKVGERAIIGNLRTSTVTEILEQNEKQVKFKNMNSTYLLTL